jgi:hypothetical protein
MPKNIDGNENVAAGLLIIVRTEVVKGFLANIPVKEKAEVLVDFDGVKTAFTLEEFKNALFPPIITTAVPTPVFKKPLQAILIAGEDGRDAVLNGTKKITIREGLRDYKEGNVLIGCHELGWAVGKKITKVQWKKLGEVTIEEMRADNFNGIEDMIVGMRRFYPEMDIDSPVTIIEWE